MFKKLLLFCILVTFSGSLGAAEALRQSVNINRDWKFQLGDITGAEITAFDDSKWQNADLPHSFSLPYFGSPNFYQGYGWYRKHLAIPGSWSGKRLSLEFDGVFRVAEVFVNGMRVGLHQGGYTGFAIDITSAVRPGDNVVAVRVNNLWNARLAPRAGEHVFSGGIYRDVRLVVTAPLHVAWYGTFVTTPQVSKEWGTVNVRTEVMNSTPAAKAATVQTVIVDHDGNPVAKVASAQTIPANSESVFNQTTTPIPQPRLWSPEHPYLYSVKTTVFDSATPVDDFTSPLGFRWFKFTPDQGFFLNGGHFYIYGANVHQDHAGWGDAVADSGFLRDVALVKEAGFSFIRGSHYPHAPAFADACDKLGVLFWSENCFWGIGGFTADGSWTSSAYPPNPANQPDFEANVKQQLAEEIRIYRNHPSIIAWSMCNEVFFTEKSAIPKMRVFLGDLVALTHSLDPTRPAAIGGAQRPLGTDRIDKIGDLAGYNGDGASLPAFQDPGIPNLVSEYGSTSAVRPGKYEPGWGDLAKDNGQPVHPWRSGQALWCMFDHGSLAGRDLGQMGIVDYFRIPKRAWYWYRNEYLHIPPPVWPANGTPAALRLTADKTTLHGTDGTDDAQLFVTVLDKDGKLISNSPPVTLSIESGPGEFPTGPSITFDPKSDIAIRDGQAAIEFRSYHGGETRIRATSPGLEDAALAITTLGEPKFIAGQSPTVKPRPYIPYTGAGQEAPLTSFGLQNPTRASSEEASHNSGLANDGNNFTFWQAQANQKNAWWCVDLEKVISIESVKLTFPWPGNWGYRIEISEDGQSGWRLLGNEAHSAGSTSVCTVTGPGSAQGRFVRVTFTQEPNGKTAALTEFDVRGRISTDNPR